MPTQPKFLIGELAKKANVNIQTIRYYERIKLLVPDVRRKAGNVRYYSENSLKTLLFIKNAQKMGFQLAEIKELLDLHKHDGVKSKRIKAKAEAKVEKVRKKIADLRDVEKSLKKLIQECEGIESESADC